MMAIRTCFLTVLFVFGFSCAGWSMGPSRGVVSSATPEATAAGVEVLRAGGNAVDAAIAVSFVLAVTEPAGSGLGGQMQVLLHPPRGAPVAINGTSYSPAALPDTIEDDELKSGYTATTVPSLVRTLGFMFERYASKTVPWEDLLAPAIRHAQEGFPLTGFRHRVLDSYASQLRKDVAASAFFLRVDGQVHPKGTLFRQPALARTLRRLADAEDGAADFYTGALARDIAADMEIHGGWITREDLAAVPEPTVRPPLKAHYRGWTVYTTPPPAGGPSVLDALAHLKTVPQEALRADESRRTMHLVDALRTAYAKRTQARESGSETTHFSIVDADGMVVSVTQSLNASYGARAANVRLGFLYNNYMSTFDPGGSDGPYRLRPNAPPASNMSAVILAKGGEPFAALGSPGGVRSIGVVVQVISHWVDLGQGIDPAVQAFRIHTKPPRRVLIEAPVISNDLVQALGAGGFDLERPGFRRASGPLNPYFGGVHAVARERAGWRGAADRRRDGTTGYAESAAN